MSTAVISKRYAKALMNLAEKSKQVDQITGELNDVADSIAAEPKLLQYLINPKVSRDAKKGMIEEILKQTKAGEMVTSFVRLLLEKRRVVLIEEIRNLFHAIADDRMGRAQAEVTVAAELNAAQEDALRKKLEAVSGKQITLSVQVNPDILGGAVAKIGSTVRDGSLRSHLKNIRQSIIEG